MVFLVGRRVIIESFEATAILPPINGFFFCVQCGSECSEIFWVSWSKKKKNPVGAGPAGQHGSLVSQAPFPEGVFDLRLRLVCSLFIVPYSHPHYFYLFKIHLFLFLLFPFLLLVTFVAILFVFM